MNYQKMGFSVSEQATQKIEVGSVIRYGSSHGTDTGLVLSVNSQYVVLWWMEDNFSDLYIRSHFNMKYFRLVKI